MKRYFLTLFLTLNANVSFAGFTDGNMLYQWLQEDEKPNGSWLMTGLFNGYVSGVVDTGNGILFCTSSGVIRGQFTAVVKKYLKITQRNGISQRIQS